MNVPHRFDNDNGAALVYSTRFSGLKPQHDPAALGIIAAQSPQRIASHIRRRKALPDPGAELLRERLVLAMTDPDASSPVAEPLQLAQHEMLRLSPSPAFSEHLQRSLGAGLSGGADPKDARHRCREPADPAVLRKVMHGFQGEKQVGASLICLQIFAYLVKAGAGALLGKRFFKKEGDLRSGGKGVHHMDTPGRVALRAVFPRHAGGVIAARQTACNGKRDHVAALTESAFPVRDIRTCAVGSAPCAAERADHRVNIQRSIIPELFGFGAYSKRNADEVRSVQRKKIAAGICRNTKLVHCVSSESQKAFYPVLKSRSGGFYQIFIIPSTAFKNPLKNFRKTVVLSVRNVYNGSMEQEVKRMIEDMESFRLPRYAQIPNVGLYLEQVVRYVNAHLAPLGEPELTSSMVSNYVKQSLIPAPIKKTYPSEHLARLLFIAVVKPVVPLEGLRLMFSIQEDSYPLPIAYDYFCDEFENMLGAAFGIAPAREGLGETQSDAKDLLRNTISATVNKVYLDRFLEEYQRRRETERPGAQQKSRK